MVFFGVFGVLIIPKWLIKVPSNIAILLNDFGNFDFLSKYGHVDLLIITIFSTNTRKIWNHPGNILFLSIWDSKNRFFFENCMF